MRDEKTKKAFIEYLDHHKDERFFQAVLGFANYYLRNNIRYLYCSSISLDYYLQHYDKFEDTFGMECDELLRIKNGNSK